MKSAPSIVSFMMSAGLMVESIDEQGQDGALLARYREGDLESFADLYRRHCRPLHFYVQSLTRDPVLSEDIVQDAFLRLLDRDPGTLKDTVKAFLYTIARNLVLDQAKKASVRQRKHPVLAVPGSREAAIPSGVAEGVSAALDRLPEEQREILILKFYGGMTFAEISELAGIPAPTVMSRYRYALDKLSRLVTQEGDLP